MSVYEASVYDEVRSAFAAELALTTEQISSDSRLNELPGLDSVKLLRVITTLEHAHGIGLDDDQLYELQEVGDVAKLVERELALSPLPVGE